MARGAVRSVELCGRQPLLLRTLGRETARLGWDLDEVAVELRQAVATPFHQTMPRSDTLAAFADQDMAYSTLSPPARRLLRLLSLSPESFGRGASGALLGPSARRPRWSGPSASGASDGIGELLAELSSGRFIDGSGGRYQVRKLLAPTVRFHLLLDEPVGQRVRAQRRVLRHLARQAARQAARLHAPPDGRSGDDPMAWFAVHHHLLQSLVIGGPSGPRPHQPLAPRVRRWRFHLAEALSGWYEVTWRLDEWATMCEAILATPGSADDPRSASWAHNQLGVLHRRQGELGDARHQFVQARSLRRGSRRGTAQVLMNEGLVLLADDDHEPAVQRLRLAGQHRPSADRLGRALTDLALGVAELASGDVDDARSTFARAARMFGELDDPRREGAALTNLGLAQWRRGERAAATDTWEQALEVYDRVDDRYGRAAALLNLGASQLLVGSAEEDDIRAALARLDESDHLWASLGVASPGRGRTLLHKADAQSLLGRQDEARLAWKQASEICREAGDDAGHAAAADRLLELNPEV